MKILVFIALLVQYVYCVGTLTTVDTPAVMTGGMSCAALGIDMAAPNTGYSMIDSKRSGTAVNATVTGYSSASYYMVGTYNAFPKYPCDLTLIYKFYNSGNTLIGLQYVPFNSAYYGCQDTITFPVGTTKFQFDIFFRDVFNQLMLSCDVYYHFDYNV